MINMSKRMKARMLNTKPARFVGGTEGTLMVTLCVHNMQVDQILSLSRPPKKPKITPSTLNMTNSPPPTCLDTQVLCGLVCASNNCLKIFNYHQHWEVNNLSLNICVLRKMMICFQNLFPYFSHNPLFCFVLLRSPIRHHLHHIVRSCASVKMHQDRNYFFNFVF